MRCAAGWSRCAARWTTTRDVPGSTWGTASPGGGSEPLQGGARRPLRVSAREEPAEARVLRSVESGHTDPAGMQALMSDLGIAAPSALMDSQAKYVSLAAGAGGFIFRLVSPDRPDYREWIWDQAAGSLLVTEAGGRVTDLFGGGVAFSRGRRLVW